MSVMAMAGIAARRSVQSGAGLKLGARPPATGADLLKMIGAYIPTDVTTIYIAAAGAMAAVPAPGVSTEAKLNVAIISSLVALFAAWVLAHRAARKAASDAGQSPPAPGTTLKAGWYEILAAGVALFIWATAMPDSWLDWGLYGPILPPFVVGFASILIGGLAYLLNRTA